MFSFMQNNYRARLYRGYIVNAPWTFTAVWTAVKQFIEETTAMKISITSKTTDEKILTHINTEQLEKKYGGEAANVTKYWPPSPPNGEFFVTGDVPSQIFKK